jgi:adenylate cyclase
MPTDSGRLDRKLAAILYADVAGYSRLTGEDEEGTHRRLSAYLDAITTTINGYHGEVLHYAGDAVLADFTTVSDALICAAAIQEDLKVRNQDLPDDRKVQFRIGVNLGEVIADRGEIYGDGVNVAARLEGLAEPGGFCISGTVYDAIGSKLPLEYEFLGEQTVKNIDKPVRAYSARLSSGAALPAPAVRAKTRRPARHLVITAGAGILLAIGIAVVVWLAPWTLTMERASQEGAALPLPDKPSIAVLPFVNLSADPQQEYFSDGITNDIITDLSKFSSLFVIASNSVFAYKGKAVKIQDVGRDLGVRYVLEGSVQKVADKVRVNAQLIDATTRHHVWAERYDRGLKDLFVVQDDIVQAIVGALAVKVAEVERERVMRKDTDSLEAYDYVLRGRAYLSRITRSDNLEARKMFQRAIELDPNYATAYVGLGRTYRVAVGHGWTEFLNEALQKAQDLAEQALRLQDSADAHDLLGSIYLVRGRYDLAIQELERAITLNPNDSDSLAGLGSVMLYTGKTNEAVQAIETALRFNPAINTDFLYELGIAYYLQTQYRKAIEIFERGKAKNPNYAFIHAVLAAAYAQVGRPADATREAEMVRRLDPFFEVASFGSKFRNNQDRERIAEGLRKAGLR